MEQLAGTVGGLYDFVTLNIPNGGGAAVTTAGTARVSGNTLSICQWPGQVAIPQNCGTSLPNGALQNYALRVDGNDYSGINTVTGQSLAYSFQLAIIGATSALVSRTVPNSCSSAYPTPLPSPAGSPAEPAPAMTG